MYDTDHRHVMTARMGLSETEGTAVRRVGRRTVLPLMRREGAVSWVSPWWPINRDLFSPFYSSLKIKNHPRALFLSLFTSATFLNHIYFGIFFKSQTLSKFTSSPSDTMARTARTHKETVSPDFTETERPDPSEERTASDVEEQVAEASHRVVTPEEQAEEFEVDPEVPYNDDLGTQVPMD